MDWVLIGTVVFTGLTVVFSALIILIVMIYIMGKIFTSIDKKKRGKQKKVSAAPAQAVTAAPSLPQQNASDEDEEIVAVISAAVAAYMGGQKHVIRRIRRAAPKQGSNVRPAWNAAGVLENTRPF